MPKQKNGKKSSRVSLKKSELERNAQDISILVLTMMAVAKRLSTSQQQKLAEVVQAFSRSQLDQRKLVLHFTLYPSMGGWRKIFVQCLFQTKDAYFSLRIPAKLKPELLQYFKKIGIY